MIKTDRTTQDLLKSLGRVPGTRYTGVVCTPIAFTAPEREWVDNSGVLRKAERPQITFDSALGDVVCYVFREGTETLADAVVRTLNHLGLDMDPRKWGPVETTVTVSRHRNLIIEVPRPATKADPKDSNEEVLSALGL